MYPACSRLSRQLASASHRSCARGRASPVSTADQVPAALTRYFPSLRFAVRCRWGLVVLAAIASQPVRIIAQPDVVRFARGGAQILSGNFSTEYAASWMQGGPFEMFASLAMLPFPFQRQSSFVMRSDTELVPTHAGIAAILMALTLICVRWVRRYVGLAPSPRAEFIVGLATLAIIARGWVWWGGHAAEVAIPLLWVWGAVLARRDRTWVAAIVLGLSAGWEPWGVLAAPLLLLDRHPRRLLAGTMIFSVSATAPYIPFVASGRFALFDYSWPIEPQTLVGTLWPNLDSFPYQLRVVQGGAAMFVASILVMRMGRQPAVVWLAPYALVATRLLFDPCNFLYYWFPLLVLCCVGLSLAREAESPAYWVGLAALAAAPVLIYQTQAPWVGSPTAIMFLIAAAFVFAAHQRRHAQARPSA